MSIQGVLRGVRVFRGVKGVFRGVFRGVKGVKELSLPSVADGYCIMFNVYC